MNKDSKVSKLKIHYIEYFSIWLVIQILIVNDKYIAISAVQHERGPRKPKVAIKQDFFTDKYVKNS